MGTKERRWVPKAFFYTGLLWSCDPINNNDIIIQTAFQNDRIDIFKKGSIKQKKGLT